MSNPFFNFATDSDITGAPTIPFANISAPISPPPWSDAVGHWRFGGSSASLTDLVNGKIIRLGAAQTALTAGSGYTSAPSATFANNCQCTISTTSGSNTIIVTAVASGSLYVGAGVSVAGIPAGAYIMALGTGAGGTGTYVLAVNGSQTAAQATATATGVSAVVGLIPVVDISGSALFSVGYSGTVADDSTAVGAVTLSGGGGSGGAATLSRGAAPTYNAASIVMGTGRNNGLAIPIPDIATFTEVFLAKRPSAGTKQQIAGTNRYVATGGDNYYWDTDNLLHIQSRNSTLSGALTTSNITPPAALTAGSWYALVVSYDGSQRRTVVVDSAGNSSGIDTQNGVYGPSARFRALKDTNWDFASWNTALEMAAYANWATSKTAAQMTAIAYDALFDGKARGLF